MAVDEQRFMTKTQHYRKVTKPLLERQRRARMNLYLDELKDLVIEGMQADGEHITKLEKADILEMTVTYLRAHKHEFAATDKTNMSGEINLEKFRDGYTQAAFEVSKIFATLPDLDVKFGTRLMKHLGYQLNDMRQSNNVTSDEFVKPTHPISKPKPRRNEAATTTVTAKRQKLAENHDEEVWRPW